MKKEKNTENEKKASWKEWIVLVLLFLVLVFVLPKYVLQRTYVNGHSMEDTLQNGDFVFREKVSNYVSDPDRFDVIVFYSEVLEEDCIKRVIGLPGETVQIKDGKIYIDNQLLKESYGMEAISDPGIAGSPVTLGKSEYFVLGDNREDSTDSRAEGIGPVKKSEMDGRAFLRIWPLNKVGIIN